MKMFVITKEAYRNNGIKVTVDNNGALWLNERQTEEKLGQSKKKGCITQESIKFKEGLGYNVNDVFNTKEETIK